MVVLHSGKEEVALTTLARALPKLLWCGYAFSKAIGKCNSMLYAKHMWSIILDGVFLQEDKFRNEV